MRSTLRALVIAVVFLLGASTVDGAVLCGRRRADGSLNSLVRVREACRTKEVTLTPQDVGFCCAASPATTTTSTSTVSSTEPCPTTTTLGAPGCGGPTCLGLCPADQTCASDGNGGCACVGPLRCGGAGNQCGGSCGAAQACLAVPVPAGCPGIGCSCQ